MLDLDGQSPPDFGDVFSLFLLQTPVKLSTSTTENESEFWAAWIAKIALDSGQPRPVLDTSALNVPFLFCILLNVHLERFIFCTKKLKKEWKKNQLLRFLSYICIVYYNAFMMSSLILFYYNVSELCFY